MKKDIFSWNKFINQISVVNTNVNTKKTISGECPKCISTNCVLIGSEYSHGAYYDKMQCNDCGEEWEEIFEYKKWRKINE